MSHNNIKTCRNSIHYFIYSDIMTKLTERNGVYDKKTRSMLICNHAELSFLTVNNICFVMLRTLLKNEFHFCCPLAPPCLDPPMTVLLNCHLMPLHIKINP